jgi:hypothetical protein
MPHRLPVLPLQYIWCQVRVLFFCRGNAYCVR